MSYDGSGNATLVITTDSSGVTSVVTNLYNTTFHEVTETIDADGTTTLYTLDSGGDVTQEIDAAGTSVAATTGYGWSDGLPTSVVDPDGNTSLYLYNSADQETAEYDYDSSGNLIDEQTFTYDGGGYAITNTDGVGSGAPETTTTSYDGRGNLLVQTNPAGDSTTNAYSAASFVTQTISDGVTSAYVYDAAGNQTEESDSAAGVTAQTTTNLYDAAGNLTETIDPDNNTTLYLYNSDNEQTAVIDPTGATTLYYYDADGNVTEMIDPDSNTTLFGYDEADRLITTYTEDLHGNEIGSVTYGYDDDDNITFTEDGDGTITRDAFNSEGWLVSEVVTNGGTIISEVTYAYDKDGNPTTTTDGDGTVTSDQYDDGELVSEVVTAGGSTISAEGCSYDAFGNTTGTTDAYGNVTDDTFDGDNRLTSEIVRNGSETLSAVTYLYDSNGNTTETIQGAGSDVEVTYDTYDGFSRLTSEVVKDGTGSGANVLSSQSYGYDQDDNVTSSTDGDGDLTSTTYDADGNVLTQVMTHDGTTISYLSQAYDAAGNVTYALDGAGNATSSIYDGGNLVSQVVKNGSTILSDYTYSYDDAGNVTGTTDVYGNVTDDTYVGDQLITERVTDADGNTISYESNVYDNAGNVIETINGDGDITMNSYNGNELTETVAGYGTTAAATTLYGYDENGNQTSEVDPDNNTTLYTYDANSDVLTTANASGTTTYAYNELGQMTSAIDADNRTISYSYDGTNLTTETWYNSSGTQTEQMTWSYDEDGNILTAGNSAGSYTMTYVGNQMATQIDPSGLTLSYTYDDAGDLTKTVDSQGGTTMYSYEDGLVTMKTFSNGTSQMGVVFGYDEEGNLTTETRYANTALTTLAGSTTNTYDDNVLTSIVDKDASGNVLQSFSYTYDDAGQLTTQVADGVTTAYQYDATGEMTAAGTQTYSYDANGNPDEAGNTVSSDNEVTVNNGTTQSFDAVGNLTQSVDSSGNTWSYSYDNANQLISAVETNDGTTLVSATFVYDVFGNRISETLTQGGTTTTTNMVYDTNSGTLYADENSSGTITTWYVSNVNGTNQWLARVDSTGTNWLLSDYQGSVTGVVSQSTGNYTLVTYDANGNVTNTSYFQAGGTATTSSNAPEVGRLGWQGGEFEAAIGLEKFGIRWYKSQTQQWISQDPSGLSTGPNPYESRGDAATDNVDPNGEADVNVNGGPREPLLKPIGLTDAGLTTPPSVDISFNPQPLSLSEMFLKDLGTRMQTLYNSKNAASLDALTEWRNVMADVPVPINGFPPPSVGGAYEVTAGQLFTAVTGAAQTSGMQWAKDALSTSSVFGAVKDAKKAWGDQPVLEQLLGDAGATLLGLGLAYGLAQEKGILGNVTLPVGQFKFTQEIHSMELPLDGKAIFQINPLVDVNSSDSQVRYVTGWDMIYQPQSGNWRLSLGGSMGVNVSGKTESGGQRGRLEPANIHLGIIKFFGQP